VTARYFAMVRHADVSRWERVGWLNTGPLPSTHGEWSCGLVWLCECKCIKPR
jgi:hypothetical protein